MCATLLNPNQPNQCFTASPVRARERQIRAPKKGILGGTTRVPYWENVTVYPYNGCIVGANPIVRRVMSLTCTLKRMHANQHALKPAVLFSVQFTHSHQPLHSVSVAVAVIVVPVFEKTLLSSQLRFSRQLALA